MSKLLPVLFVASLMLTSCFSSTDQGTSSPISKNGSETTTALVEQSGSSSTGANVPLMKTGATVRTASGTSITVSTNGPDLRPMTPEELKAFQNSK